MNDYFDKWLNAVGIGSKDSSLKQKIQHHQDRHMDLLFSYQDLCQNTFNEMLTSSMKGDLNTMQNAHKEFLEGLNKTFEAIFANHLELASQAPEEMNNILNMHRKHYEKFFDNFPQISQIKSQIDRNNMMKNVNKLALGTMSAILASVAMPSAGTASLSTLDKEPTEMSQTSVRSSAQPTVLREAQLDYLPYTRPFYPQTHVLVPHENFDKELAKSSKIYSFAFPKATMLHPYHPGLNSRAVKLPNGKTMHYGHPSTPLFMHLPASYLPNLPDVIQSKIARSAIQNLKIMVIAQDYPWQDRTQICLRPHYATEPNMVNKPPNVNIARHIDTGVFSLTKDIVTLEGKAPNSFSECEIVTHTDDSQIHQIVLSADQPQITGLSTQGQTFWSYVGYQDDQGKNTAIVTLHWLLNDAQNHVLQKTLDTILPNVGDNLDNMLSVVNHLQKSTEFNDGGDHVVQLANLMGFLAPKVTYNIQQTDDTPCEVDGLSGAEGSLRWTDKPHATIIVPITHGAQMLSFITSAYVPGDHVQRATISINNNPLNGPFVYDHAHSTKTITTTIPTGIDLAVCEFDIPTTLSPGVSDPRELGIAFRGIEESLPYSLSRTTQHFLGQNTEFPFELRTGFSGAEGTHHWTDGGTAAIRIPLDADINRRPHAITFLNVSAFTPGQHTQLVKVKLNGVLVSQHIFSEAQNAQTIKVPLPINLDGGATLEFEMPNTLSPGSNDLRNLGLSLNEVVLTYLR